MNNDIEEFLKELEGYSIEETDLEYVSLAEQYYGLFGDIIPVGMFKTKVSDEDLKILIKKCIETGSNQEIKQLISEVSDGILF